MAVELLDFGALSRLLSGMCYPDQRQVAHQYGIPHPGLLTSLVFLTPFQLLSHLLKLISIK
jgi:abortive infection bacteriophage resistance protein